MSVYSYFPRLEKLIPSTQKAIDHQSRKKKSKPVENIRIGTKTKLSLIIPHLLIQISLKFRPPTKTKVMKVVKRAI